MISDERIMGFVEGEGCFSVGIERYVDSKTRKSNKRNKIKNPCVALVRPSFRVVCVKEDIFILEEIKSALGVGQIYIQKRASLNPNHRDVSHYYVQSFEDLCKIREYFASKLFYTKKGEDFKKWAEILDLIVRKEHLTKEGLLKICELRDGMNTRKGKTKKRSIQQVQSLLQHPELRFIHNSEIDSSLNKSKAEFNI
ncbi:MAG: LAGLIDADG family homing endonuclease [Candidatus Diapherotrites archaeon]|nr:LAGLIDADG family homing endonuclease [Candidatus Diapherotrites archaeon]